MAFNILFFSIDPPPNNPNNDGGNSFLEVVKTVLISGKLTKAQRYIIIFTLSYFAFAAVMLLAPNIVTIFAIIFGRDLSEIQPVIPVKNILHGLYFIVGIGMLYFILYCIPEIIERYKKLK